MLLPRAATEHSAAGPGCAEQGTVSRMKRPAGRDGILPCHGDSPSSSLSRGREDRSKRTGTHLLRHREQERSKAVLQYWLQEAASAPVHRKYWFLSKCVAVTGAARRGGGNARAGSVLNLWPREAGQPGASPRPPEALPRGASRSSLS